MEWTDLPICRLCECPAADGVVPVSRVDLQKLSEWCLIHLDEELTELDFDNDVLCHYCILDARFLAENDGDNGDELRWWPEEVESQSGILKLLYKYSGVVKNCWVNLECIKVNEEQEDEEEEDFIDLTNDNQSNSDDEVAIIEIIPRPESHCQQQVKTVPTPAQLSIQQQNNPTNGILLLRAPATPSGQTFVLPSVTGGTSQVIYYIPKEESVPQPQITQLVTPGGYSFFSALNTFISPTNFVVPPPPPPPRLQVQAPSLGRRIAPAPQKTPVLITPECKSKEIVFCKTNKRHSTSFKKRIKRKECTTKKLIKNASVKIQENVSKPLKPFECIFCCKSYAFKDGLQLHVLTKHKDIALQCIHCKEFCTSQENLDLHFKKYHEANEKRKSHQCSECDQRFISLKTLDSHFEKKHGNKIFQCENCSKTFTTKKYLRNHINTHLFVSKCYICSSVFSTRSALKRHQNSRACRRCYKLFACANVLKEHRLKCKFICYICPKDREFHSEVTLRHHLFLHTLTTKRKFRSKVVENNDCAGQKKWLKCDFCGKCFVNRQSITRHFLLIHKIGESNYVCGICNKKFAAKVTLSNHVQFTHMRELVKCKICNISIREDCLKSHCMVNHSVLI